MESIPAILDELIKLLEHPQFYVVVFILSIYFIRVFELRMRKERQVIEEYKDLLKSIRDDRTTLLARNQVLTKTLEKCQDNLNVAEAKCDVLVEQLENCENSLHEKK